MTAKHENYLYDLGLLIKERAREARRQRNDLPLDSVDRAFQAGRLLAFNETISIMQQQADGFSIPLADLQLEDVDPDRDFT
jgi:hypothetical protein